MSDYEFTLPIYGIIKQTKSNKNAAITFNWCRAAKCWVYDAAKKKFKRHMRAQIKQFDPIDTKIKIKYVYYAKRNGTDLDNFVSVVKKFFQDALSEHGFIPDDKATYIIKSSEEYGGVDKDNPRVMAYINIVE